MKDLIIIDQINPLQLFDGKSLDPLLEQITKQVKESIPDTTTASGRKDIASLAHKVAKSKTFLDSAGKTLVAEWKNKAKVVDAERKKMRDYLDDLKEETRLPLTKWEEVEQEKRLVIEHKIENFKALSEFNDGDFGDPFSSNKLKENLTSVKAIIIDDSFGDYAPQAAVAKEEAIYKLEALIIKRLKEEADKAELERLRKEAEERTKKDEEERLRKEGEERAKIKAEAKARVEKERVELETKQKAEAEQKERDRIEKEKQDAIDAKIELERKVKEAEELAEKQKKQAEQDAIDAKIEAAKETERVKQETIRREIEAKKQATIDAETATRLERERIEKEKAIEIEAAKIREADKKHKSGINNAAMDALVLVGLNKVDAKKVVIAIVSGKIPHTKISY